MPDYLIRVSTNVILGRDALDDLEDIVYDELTNTYGGSIEVDAEGVAATDVAAQYD